MPAATAVLGSASIAGAGSRLKLRQGTPVDIDLQNKGDDLAGYRSGRDLFD